MDPDEDDILNFRFRYQTLPEIYSVLDHLINHQLERILYEDVISESMNSYQDELLRKNDTIKISGKYKTFFFKDEDCRNNKCFICMEEFNPEDIVLKIDCMHVFHSDCIKEGVKYNAKCPMCKQKIQIDE